MFSKENIAQSILVYAIFDLVLLQLIFGTFLRRQRDKGKGRRYLVGVSFIFLGIILTSFGLFLTVGSLINQGGTINSGMIAGITPFMVVGIPAVVIGIFLVNNP